MSANSTLVGSTPVEIYANAEKSHALISNGNSDIEKLKMNDEPPDGGYGWVVVICTFLVYSVTWGCTSIFGVFFSFYRKNQYFPGATDTDFAFIGGLSISCSMLVAPLANYLSKQHNFKVPLAAGVLVFVLSQIFSGLSTRIWQLLLTQGVMFGMGLGLIFVPTLPLTNQWFTRKRALAGGITAAGTGGGGLVLSLTTQTIIQRLGLRWAFFINAFIAVVVLVPAVFLLKSKVHPIEAKFEPVQYQLLWHSGFVFVWLWGFFSIFGFTVALYTLGTYATSRSASLQSLLAAGQMIGRPLAGLVMDRFGRINMTSFLTLVAGLSCLVVWMFAHSYGVLVFFALVQGMVGGIFWSSAGPITAEVVGLSELGSALSVLWLSIVIPCTFSEPIAVWLLGYSQHHLERTGADAFLISIAFSGSAFLAAAMILFGAKRWKQGNWTLFTKA